MHKMLKKKKALSEVVATVLIILITVVTATLIAQFLVPYVSNTLTKSSECLNYNNGYFQFEEKVGIKDAEKYNCLDNRTTTTTPPTGYLLFGASIKARPSEQDVIDKVEGFNLAFIDETSSKSIVIKPGVQDNKFKILGKNFGDALAVPSNGEVFTYVYSETDPGKNYQTIEVYPILKSGRQCTSARDRITIEPCSGVDLT